MDNRLHYGEDKTIHRTSYVDVETDAKGKVVAVWFRCMRLPFVQNVVDDERAAQRSAGPEAWPILAIDFALVEPTEGAS